MSNINSIKNNREYCVLYKEDKGYYLSKTKVADSMGLEYVSAGSKKECLDYIDNKNTEILRGAE